MRKFVIWVKIHWIKILLIILGLSFTAGLILYITYVINAYNSLESFTKRQAAGSMALQMPMLLFVYTLFMAMHGVLTWYFMSGRATGAIKSKPINPKDTKIQWSDIIGMEEAKKEAMEVVRLIKDQSLQKSIGGGIIKGTLLLGPPGCGKTYLAKAMASECGLPMIPAVGSEFVAMFMGQGAARIKSLFQQARSQAKIHGGCIIFIDEIDAFAQPRQLDRGGGATTSSNATINQFLTEMDGLGKSENNIVVFAATNAEEDNLDEAIMRSGRFDRKIYVEKPNERERVALIKYYLSKITADKNINIELIANKSKWFSPSDINNLVKEASIIALRDRAPGINQNHLEQSLKRIIRSVEKMGEDKILGDSVNVKWGELIGMEETKKDAWEIVELLKDRSRLKVVGGDIIKGIMMIGPPGCGKTYLAKAMATESGYPFISCVGSDFINKQWVGTGITKLTQVFKEARRVAKTEGGCIIFIDEIDAFIRPRESRGVESGGDVHYNSTINQFLAELDGLKGHEDEGHVVVLAATNVPENKLDEAVLRSGRFDRKIYFNKPNAKDRKALLEFYLRKVDHEADLNLEDLAEKAKWFSAADIKNMVRESGILALRADRKIVNKEDLLQALDRVMVSVEQMGENKILGGKVNVKWSDIIGMEDVKEEAWEIVKMLKDRALVQAVGGKIVKGIVMFGPPGCGKTYLAKAIATESGYPFISIAGSEMVGIFVGEAAKKMKELFIEARSLAKSEGGCIIFFDEIDSFARHRVQDRGFGGATSHNATINQFLTEIDGLRQSENNIVVLAATNVGERELDPAILRAGRLERKIHVKLPTNDERKDIFKFYLAKVRVADDVNPDKLARITVGFTPANVDNMIREAGLIALREKKETIEFKHMLEAYNRITMGALTKQKFNKKSVTRTAYHEAGHAIITYLVHPTDEVYIATIRPRGGALGFIDARAVEDLEVNSPNREHWHAELQVLLAGYVAEKITFGTTASGVGGGPGSDFYRAMRIASYMVNSLGMGQTGLVGDFTALENEGGELSVSEKTKETLDQDTQLILQTCLKKTTEFLTRHKDLLEHFARILIEKQEIYSEEIVAIFKKFNVEPATKYNQDERFNYDQKI
jgi:ATP-dependent metalloprotease FtsH